MSPDRCKRCGHAPSVRHTSIEVEGKQRDNWRVKCDTCGLAGSGALTREGAVKSWHTANYKMHGTTQAGPSQQFTRAGVGDRGPALESGTPDKFAPRKG